MIQEKAPTFAKELNAEDLQASDCWLRRWRERNLIIFNTVLGELKSVNQKWLLGGGKRLFRLVYQDIIKTY